jgi:hypothetical protein
VRAGLWVVWLVGVTVSVPIAALVCVLVTLFVLVVPAGAVVPDLIAVGLILVGGFFSVAMLIFDRQALEAEPGDVDLFTR